MFPVPLPWKAMLVTLSLLTCWRGGACAADNPALTPLEFFEARIRPVLIDQCYECHNSADSAKGGLALDSRQGLLDGGDSGEIIVPGKPAESRLLAILRHEEAGLKMPEGKGKLDNKIIADFEQWIATGAFDPRDKPLTAVELAKATSWEHVLAKRKQWWSFQPLQNASPPQDAVNSWSHHPIDLFIFAKLRENKLEPGPAAEPATRLRRVFFTLIGLPPTVTEINQWSERITTQQGFEELVDHLLSRPQFGEKWARHWMDWIRYAESHGSEGDPTIDNAWQFRDYLIRALNADVPYDQLVREHIAGDLLEQPRINTALGINESAIGPAHWRMVFHGFTPTDALDEKVRFIDDEINTFTKAFLGLTVSCARCHDHKFDPISQRDYYALFGILGSCRPGRTLIETPDRLHAQRDQLVALKPQIRSALATDWLQQGEQIRSVLLQDPGPVKSADSPTHWLHPWFLLRKELQSGVDFKTAWNNRNAAWKSDLQRRNEADARKSEKRWDLTQDRSFQKWNRFGTGLPEETTRAGEFSVTTSGDSVLSAIYPAGLYSHLLSSKHPARLSSQTIKLDGNYDLWVQVLGEGGATARYVVYDYPRTGTVFPIRSLAPEWKWEKLDLTYWNGDEFRVELATGKDAPVQVNNESRSWFGIRDAQLIPKGEVGPQGETLEILDPLFEAASLNPPQSMQELADLAQTVILNSIKAWQNGNLNDAQASLLHACLKQNLLPNQLEKLPSVKPLVLKYRQLEEAVIVPTRVPGIDETIAQNQALMIRGNHKTLGDEVPRRFLEVFNSPPYKTSLSGRRQLAEDILVSASPLTRRVIVNRLWHHLFGRGLVGTPDNFGRLGHMPTHPELLDYLANKMSEQGWSIKQAVRLMVTSKTWQLSSQPSAVAHQRDPDNQFLSHAHLRRLEAESIRDALLAVSGNLSPDLYGSPADGGSNRRSVYVRVQRNALDPFLRTFDFPEPFSATGRRDATNVPAQSLTLLNDDRVASLASAWSTRLLNDNTLTDNAARIQAMFMTALNRAPQPAETARFQEYLQQTQDRQARLIELATSLREDIEVSQAQLRTLIDPVRQRLIQQSRSAASRESQSVPKPIARWEFETDFKDSIGSAHGEARGGARLENGAVTVRQQGHVVTAPLQQTIKQKSLEVWVQLDSLDQRAGGVMTIQTPDGGIFDSIVYAEQSPRQWLSGSNFFARTQPFQGANESEAAIREVHLAIVYAQDGTVVGYRDGKPYGKPYKSNGPQEFKAGEAVVTFGVRHLPAGGNKMLSGRILRAQLYDRALSAEEIAATSQSSPFFVSEAQVLEALTELERAQVLATQTRIKKRERELESLGTVPESISPDAAWTELARAIFTFKEFIYLK